MYDLRSCDLQSLASFLLTLYAAAGRETYINTILTGLTALLPCSYTSYNEIDLSARQTFYKSHGIDQALYERIHPTFKAYLHQHPYGQRVLTTPDYGVRTLSDFIPDRMFRRLDLYQEYYRHLGVSRQLGVSLSVPPGLFIPIMINRDGRDYGSRERQMLDALRPHLTQAFQNAHAWERLRQHHSCLQKLFRTINKALIATDRRGKVHWASSGTEDLLLRHRLLDPKPSSYLPSPLLNWFLHSMRRSDPQTILSTPVTPLRLRTARGALTVHLLNDAEGTRLLIEEEPGALPLDTVPEWSLSSRESEVLQLLATGKNNEQIAMALHISRHTVHKHLERIYAKLGVENRTAAAGRLWELPSADV
jgi:DNA-binding CsgD family transcriptional regulator